MMLTIDQMHEMMVMQNELNTRINVDWIEANYPWHRAIMVEAVEALEHVGWKWWKHQKPDLAQAQLELVDIWHFVLSMSIQEYHGDMGAASRALHHYLFKAELFDMTLFNQREVLDQLVSVAAAGRINGPAFKSLMHAWGLGWEQLRVQYLSKNVLNTFRQTHGYKEGSYVKEWFGKEDNEVLSEIMTAHPGFAAVELYRELGKKYAEVTT